jgi:hypothetical protein
MDKNDEIINLRQELMKLYQELLDGNITKRPIEELEAIRQKITDITFKLSDDTRKIKNLH